MTAFQLPESAQAPGTSTIVRLGPVTRSSFRQYRKSTAVTGYKEFPGRSHYTIGEQGWEHLADHLVLSGDVLLLCSDGLHGAIPAADMADIVTRNTDLNAAAHELIDAANETRSEE